MLLVVYGSLGAGNGEALLVCLGFCGLFSPGKRIVGSANDKGDSAAPLKSPPQTPQSRGCWPRRAAPLLSGLGLWFQAVLFRYNIVLHFSGNFGVCVSQVTHRLEDSEVLPP